MLALLNLRPSAPFAFGVGNPGFEVGDELELGDVLEEGDPFSLLPPILTVPPRYGWDVGANTLAS